MTDYQVKYQQFAESRRHNKAMEVLGQQEADTHAVDAATRRNALAWEKKRYALDTLRSIGSRMDKGVSDMLDNVWHIGDQAHEAGLSAMKLLFK